MRRAPSNRPGARQLHVTVGRLILDADGIDRGLDCRAGFSQDVPAFDPSCRRALAPGNFLGAARGVRIDRLTADRIQQNRPRTCRRATCDTVGRCELAPLFPGCELGCVERARDVEPAELRSPDGVSQPANRGISQAAGLDRRGQRGRRELPRPGGGFVRGFPARHGLSSVLIARQSGRGEKASSSEKRAGRRQNEDRCLLQRAKRTAGSSVALPYGAPPVPLFPVPNAPRLLPARAGTVDPRPGSGRGEPLHVGDDCVALPTSRAWDRRFGGVALGLTPGGEPAMMLCGVDHRDAPRHRL
jgi:hypothetical protein